MTKLKFRNKLALYAPMMLAGLAAVGFGGKAHADNVQDTQPAQQTNQQATMQPSNIQTGQADHQSTVTNWNQKPQNVSNPISKPNQSQTSGGAEYIMPGVPIVGQGLPQHGNSYPWDHSGTQANTNMNKLMDSYMAAPLGLQVEQAAAILGAASVTNPNLQDHGFDQPVNTPQGNMYSLGIFTVDRTTEVSYEDYCNKNNLDPRDPMNLAKGPFLANGTDWRTYWNQNDGQSSDLAEHFIQTFLPTDEDSSDSERPKADDIDGVKEDDMINHPNINPNTNYKNAYQVPVTIQFFKNGHKPITGHITFNVNPTIVEGYDSSNKDLTVDHLINGTAPEGERSNSDYFGNIMNQVPIGYNNQQGYQINNPGSLVVKNGNKTSTVLEITVQPADGNQDNPNDNKSHMAYPQSDGSGDTPTPSNDSSNGTDMNNAKANGFQPGQPGKGMENGNTHSDSADQKGASSPSEANDSGGSNGGGSGSGSGGGNAAAAGAGAGAAGGAAGAGGAGGAANGTAGGVAGGGEGNNNAIVPGPNNVIDGSGTGGDAAANNNPNNNNVIANGDVVNNNDHDRTAQNIVKHDYDTEVNEDKALAALIASFGDNDQKQHGVLPDLAEINKDRALDRLQQQDEANAEQQLNDGDQWNDQSGDIQAAAGQTQGQGELASMEDQYQTASMEQSLAVKSQIASLRASASASADQKAVNEDFSNPFKDAFRRTNRKNNRRHFSRRHKRANSRQNKRTREDSQAADNLLGSFERAAEGNEGTQAKSANDNFVNMFDQDAGEILGK